MTTPPPARRVLTAQRVSGFVESVIREMTRVAAEVGALNLAQGFPDWDPPAELREAAKRAIDEGYNQYAITWGAPQIREALAEKYRSFNGLEIDPRENITVTCGATEAMMSAMLATVNPGEEVIIFEPWYENYGPDAIISGARPVYVPLEPPDFGFDPHRLRRAFSHRTKAIIVNTPHNPTGHVFTRGELELIASLCQEHDALAITDEIYEHILYDGREHVSIASLPGMFERTVTISGLSKTYSVTGWRLGYCIAPRPLTEAIRKTHDFLTVGAAHPLQVAAATALRFPPSFYDRLITEYSERREVMLRALREAGFDCFDPQGAYYVMTDISGFGRGDDFEFNLWLAREVGVIGVPGSSFYSTPELGRRQVRFAFCKKLETLEEAGRRLRRLASA